MWFLHAVLCFVPSGRCVLMERFDALRSADPSLAAEWRDSFLAVIDALGERTASRILAELQATASNRLVRSATRWPVNDVPAQHQVEYPGDEQLEQQVEAAVRWNAMAIVQRANHASPGLGGHLSTFAASATLQEVLRLHVWRGPEHPLGQDRVFFQGHASPGVYAHAFVEGRMDAALLDRFRRELPEDGLSSYPHPRLRPGFWEHPTVSMGLGPLNAIFAAALDRYLFDQGLVEHLPRTFCFVGDGECDEPETLGALAAASRLQLSNLVFIVVCNLQRLDGPVRGGSSVIAELAGIFEGASWRVVRLVWGSKWDALFEHPNAERLAERLSRLADGDLQRLSACGDPVQVRSELCDGDAALVELFAQVPDDAVCDLLHDRAGHDRRKVFAALSRALSDDAACRPSVVLAFCEKGFALPQVASRNAAHQVKGLSLEQLREMAAALGVDVSDDSLVDLMPAYVTPSSEAAAYLAGRIKQQGGSLPSRRLVPSALPGLASPSALDEFDAGSRGKEVSTTVAHTRLLKLLLKDASLGSRVVPIVADEGRTFGFEPLYAEFGVWAPGHQRYRSVDAHLPLVYQERYDGRFMQVGISESGGLAAFTAAGLAKWRGTPLLPIFEFYSMFGFQRVADLIWAAMDAQASGVLVGATAGRTTLHGEGLQHADGHSQAWAQSVPELWSFDPAFAFETASVYRHLLSRMAEGFPTLGYVTVYNENFVQPARPDGVSDAQVVSGGYVFHEAADRGLSGHVKLAFSGVSYNAAVAARELLASVGVSADLVSCPSVKLLVEGARARLRADRLSLPSSLSRWEQLVGDTPVVYVSEYVSSLAAPLAPLTPGGLVTLGTDGFGRSAERAALRDFFEVSPTHVALAALQALKASPAELQAAAARFQLAASVLPPWLR